MSLDVFICQFWSFHRNQSKELACLLFFSLWCCTSHNRWALSCWLGEWTQTQSAMSNEGSVFKQNVRHGDKLLGVLAGSRPTPEQNRKEQTNKENEDSATEEVTWKRQRPVQSRKSPVKLHAWGRTESINNHINVNWTDINCNDDLTCASGLSWLKKKKDRCK